MRLSLWIVVSSVAMVDGTGQWVQFLQRYSKLYPHSGRKQISAGHAGEKRQSLL